MKFGNWHAFWHQRILNRREKKEKESANNALGITIHEVIV
jgi:hypothetical protein